MKKHLVVSVLGLSMLLIALSAPAGFAGEGMIGRNASGECCILIDGACVPCDKMASSTMQCDPGQCKTMTPEECKALGCEPVQCNKTGASLSSAKSQSASVCTPGSGCEPSAACGSKARCGGERCEMKMVEVRDAKTGEVTYHLVPVAKQTVMLSKSVAAKPGTDI